MSISDCSSKVCNENIRILLSKVPEPEAIEGSCGLNPIALTAALWSPQTIILSIFLKEKSTNLLSFPPVAIISFPWATFKPQIYCECALYLMISFYVRMSWMLTYPSLLPVHIKLFVQAIEPILPECKFSSSMVGLLLEMSNTLTVPSVFPIANLVECFMNPTEQM